MSRPLVKVTGAHKAALVLGILGALLGMAAGLIVVLADIREPLLAFFGTDPLGAALRGAVGGAGVGTLFGYILGLGYWGDDGETPGSGENTE